MFIKNFRGENFAPRWWLINIDIRTFGEEKKNEYSLRCGASETGKIEEFHLDLIYRNTLSLSLSSREYYYNTHMKNLILKNSSPARKRTSISSKSWWYWEERHYNIYKPSNKKKISEICKTVKKCAVITISDARARSHRKQLKYISMCVCVSLFSI